MMSEREKRLINYLLQNGLMTEEEIEKHDFFDFEIEEAKDNRYWQLLYDTRDDEAVVRNDYILNEVLGNDWRNKYDYKKVKKKNRYELYVYLTDEEYITICKKAQERR